MTLLVRAYADEDFESLHEVRRSAILRVNIADYTPEQVRAWADRPWSRSQFENRWAWVAEMNGRAAGFIDLTPDGLVDRLFVHADLQRVGAAQALYAAMEARAREEAMAQLEVHASDTARGFFERQGFRVARRRTVHIGKVTLENSLMLKPLTSVS